MSQRPLVIAHRTAMGHAPENTLLGIERAITIGADAAEIDVRATADGVPVLLHDAQLQRTTTGHGAVTKRTYEQIRALNAGVKVLGGVFSGQHIPTLAEALSLVKGRIILVIEIKQAGIERRVVEQIRAAAAWDAVMVWSFRTASVGRVRSLERRIPCALLSREIGDSHWTLLLDKALTQDAEAVSVAYRSLTAERVSQAKRYGLSCYAWTVNELADMQRLIGYGVDGIVTDYPDRLLRLLGER